jgi:hypothetical protein
MILKIDKENLLSALIFQSKYDPLHHLDGICFDAEKKLYSSDRFRAFIGEHQTVGLKEKIIIKLKNKPPSNFNFAEINTENELIFYFSKEGLKLDVGLISIKYGTFPDIEEMIPKDFISVDSIIFNSRYINDLNLAAKIFNPQQPSLKIQFSNENKLTVNIGKTAKVILKALREN